MHDRQSVGQLTGLLQVVRCQKHGGTGCHRLADQRPHPSTVLRVQAGGGLVEEQDLGTAHDRQCELEAAAFPAGELLDLGAGAVAEAHQLQRLLDRSRQGQRPGPHPGGLGDGETGRQAALLQHDPDPWPDETPRTVGITTEYAHGPGGGRREALEHLNGRGLPGTVGPEQREQLAAEYREVHPTDRGEATPTRSAVAAPKPLDVDDMCVCVVHVNHGPARWAHTVVPGVTNPRDRLTALP